MRHRQRFWAWALFFALLLIPMGPAIVFAGDDELDAFLEETDLLANDLTAQRTVVYDPFESFNRVVFAFNDDMYVGIMRPLARGYRFVVPPEMRLCAANFFRNLAGPARAANCLFQGKWRESGRELLKFTINTIAGLGGLADIGATYPELNTSPEDLGQTLAHYGSGEGPYLVLPLLGSTNLRDTVGIIGDGFLRPANLLYSTEATAISEGFNRFNSLAFNLDDIDTLRSGALEPYESARDLYHQYRNKLIDE